MRWYTGDAVYDSVLLFALIMIPLTAISAPFVTAPYGGRFAGTKRGLRLDPRLGWLLMELPSTVSFVYFFSRGPHRGELVPRVLLLIWLIHYANRGFFFPLSIRVAKGARSSFALYSVAIGWLVTSLHGYLNGAFISTFSNQYTTAWLSDPRFIAGVAIYYSGFIINVHSDLIVRRLRAPGASGTPQYRIPYGGLFRYVTNASYFGELVAWLGFACLTWSLGGLFIFGISAANLLPRALQTHRWYRQKFPDYPGERKVLVPFLF